MKAKYIKLLGVIAVMMFASCGKATYISSEKDIVSVDVNGESGKVKLDSDGSLELVYAPEWLNAELSGSKLKYEVEANTTSKLRRGFAAIKSGEKTFTLEFIQPTTTPSYLILPKTRATISKEGVGSPIKVLTDGAEIAVECPEGLTYVYRDGKLTFNSGGHKGKAKNYTAVVTCGEQTQKITILQKGDICTTCGGRGRVTCSICKGRGGEYYYGYYYNYFTECDMCRGEGTLRCKTCGGTGKI